MEVLKSLLGDCWVYLVIIVLAFLLFKSCETSKKTQLAFEQQLKISDLKIDKYATRINTLNDSLITLNKLKQREKIKIVEVIKEVEKKINIVATLDTKGIASYYQNRYKLPVTITQYGVALKDTVARLNITELVQKDGLAQELRLTKNVLSISDKSNYVKDIIIQNKDSIIIEKDNQIGTHLDIEKLLNKSIKQEKTKKTFWQIATVTVAGFTVYSFVK
jgi:hypothetical protein